jgi:uncharacterized protein
MQIVLSAITLGLLGSFHCIGMCGPIALSLPVGKASPFKRVILVLIYNAGRILTYAILGFAFGLLGKGFVLAGYQQALSVICGAVILMAIFLPARSKIFSAQTKLPARVINKVRSYFLLLFARHKNRSFFLSGLLNGLLPCGLVYMAVAGAIATGSASGGSLFMALFGVGTLPLMLLLPLAGNLVTLPVRNYLRRGVPVILTGMALLLILRGLNLGIPYVSPRLKEEAGSCHSPISSPNKAQLLCTGQNSAHRK